MEFNGSNFSADEMHTAIQESLKGFKPRVIRSDESSRRVQVIDSPWNPGNMEEVIIIPEKDNSSSDENDSENN